MRLNQLSSYLSNDWRNIIWREWRYTPDREYAQFLFGLVVDEPADWMVVAVNFLFGTSLGALSGYVVGVTIFNFNRWWGNLTLIWTALVPLIWATGVVCGLLGIILGLQLKSSSFVNWLVFGDYP